FHQRAGQFHVPQHREAQRDGMRDRESRDYLDQLQDRRPEGLCRLPEARIEESDRTTPAYQHGGQQQRHDEEQVVGPGPDVQATVEHEAPELAPAVRPVDVEGRGRALGTEHRSRRMVVRVDGHDPAMVRIDTLEQVITQRESIRDLLVAPRRERNNVISAVCMIIDHLPLGSDRTGESVTFNRQARQRVALDGAAVRFDLTPRDFAVVVAVETDGEVEISERDVPLALELIRVAGVGPKRNVGVALLVRERDARQQRECREERRDPATPSHRPRPVAAARASGAAAAAARAADGDWTRVCLAWSASFSTTRYWK